MNIRPLFDKVVVEPVKAEEKSKGGIILTAAADLHIPNDTDLFRDAARAAEEALHAYFGT